MIKITQQCRGGTLHLVKIPKVYRTQVAKTTEKAFVEAGELFAYRKPVGVIVFPAIRDLIISEIGLGAITDTTNLFITVAIDFLRKDIRRILQRKLQSTLYHELVHIIRSELFGNPFKFFSEDLVNEGVASYVEKKVFKNKVPYVEPIPNEMKYWWQAQKILRKRRYSYEDHIEWFYGTKKLPRWIGYRLGYLLVEGYMKNNPKTSFEQLVRLKAKTILQGSGL